MQKICYYLRNKNMETYKKTGDNKNYEFIRNDLDDDEIYIKILNKRNEFNVKIANKEIKINKKSVNKIMILSNSEPEEQILFSLYKTISKNSMDNLKLNSSNNLLVDIQENKIDLISDDPLSDKTNISFENNESRSGLIQTNSIINIQNNNNIDANSDNEKVAFGKPESNSNENIIVGLPSEAIKTKWLYSLLAILGIGYIIISIVGFLNKEIDFNINILSLFLFGLFIFFAGVFGYVQINKRIYDSIFLFIFTFITLFAGIVASVLIKINKKTEKYFIICFIFGIICSVISLICFFLLNKLRKNNSVDGIKKFERLM